MERQSFIFHQEWAEAMKALAKDVRVEVYDAIIEYGLSGSTSGVLKPVAHALFTVFRARLDADISAWIDVCNKRKAASLKGVAARATKCNQMVANATKCNQMVIKRYQTVRDNDIDNVVSNETNNIDKPNGLSHCVSEKTQKNEVIPDGFVEFWSIYPKTRRVAKRDCLKKWKLHKFEAIADRIIADVRRQSASEQWTKDEGRFVPMPSTYLNQRRWEDAESVDAGKVSDFADKRQSEAISPQENHRKFLIRLIANGSDLYPLYEKNISEAEFIAANREEIEREREKINLGKGVAS